MAGMWDSGIMGGGSREKSVAEPALMDEVAAVFSFVAALCGIVLLLLLLLLSFCAMVCLDARIRTQGRHSFERLLFRTHGITYSILCRHVFHRLMISSMLFSPCCAFAAALLSDILMMVSSGSGSVSWRKRSLWEEEVVPVGSSIPWRKKYVLEERAFLGGEVSLDEEVILARRPCRKGWRG